MKYKEKNRSDLERILEKTVSRLGIGFYFSPDCLRTQLTSAGVRPQEIWRILLMTQVTGFRELLEGKRETRQADLDRYVKNALEETGLNRFVVMRLTADIALSAGIAVPYDPERFSTASAVQETAFVVPASLYGSELKKFEGAFKKRSDHGRDIDPLDLERLTALAAAGVSRAKALLGRCLLNGVELAEDVNQGVALLSEASEAGDEEASAALGDYYYRKGEWSKAYEYYTGFGALALTKKRRKAVTEILQMKKTNYGVLILSVFLFMIMVATVVFAPGASLFPAKRLLGVGSLCINAVLLILGMVRYRAKPLEQMSILPVAMLVSWTLYLAARLLF